MAVPPRASALSLDGGSARRAAVALGLGLGVAALVAFDAPLCPLATFVGVPCPGCGLTRASLALLRGDLAAAVRLHPLAPLLTPLAAGFVALSVLRFVRGAPPAAATSRPWLPARTANALAVALLVLVFGVWIARFFGAFGGPVPVRSVTSAPFRQFQAEAPLTR